MTHRQLVGEQRVAFRVPGGVAGRHAVPLREAGPWSQRHQQPAVGQAGPVDDAIGLAPRLGSGFEGWRVRLHAHSQQPGQPEPGGGEVLGGLRGGVTAEQRCGDPASVADPLGPTGEKGGGPKQRLCRAEQDGIETPRSDRGPDTESAFGVDVAVKGCECGDLVHRRDARGYRSCARRADEDEARLGDPLPQGAQEWGGLQRLADSPVDHDGDVHLRQSIDSRW